MIRYLYIVEDDTTGNRTAQQRVRSAKFQATRNNITGKVWRVTINRPAGRELYSALYNREEDGLSDWTLVNLIEKGRLRKLSPSVSA